MQLENPKKIDFSAIEYTSSWHFIPFKKYWKYYIGFTFLFFIASVALKEIGFFLSIFGAIWYFGRIIDEGKKHTFEKFAANNGWKISDKSFETPVGIRWMGHSHRSQNVISGLFMGKPFELAEHSYVVGEGKGSTSFKVTIMQLEIDKFFPYILLDSKNNSGGAAQVPKNTEKLSLEGDFDKFFQMYTQPDHRIDALSVISPDVMQTVMNSTKSYDIEVYQNKV